MAIALIAVSLFCALLLLRLLLIKLQLRSIRRQLRQRVKENAQSFIYLEVQEKNIKEMIRLFNEILKQESSLRAEKEVRERELRDLITNISHDLRTPLTAMKGYLQLLSRCEIGENGREYLDVCFRHTDELEGRIRQFFEYSYWNSREEEILLGSVNIVNLVAEVMTDFVPLFEENGLSMHLKDDTRGKVLGNEDLLKRMVQNLLKNCLQYAVGEVTVSIGEEDMQNPNETDRIFIAVSNRMQSDIKVDEALVFTRFYAGGTSGSRSTGLGLSIVKILAEKMGGEAFAKRENEVFTVGFFLKKY